ncbi:PREDICTED: platelet-activating factor acetylhydrolase IB subunit beta isoform X2 [Propithecus coquereli]|uniref:Platelet-activating factor acetylhydrolase IB subunit alpha2 n=1 Tax=Propithecus coquereli TaxID=379532 RepID=A0A2K6FW45_PROCO|nr:PREDICTED: platelet-activating factor acetylhydrolase IB subunit beta isoform X2 [Propithecus coquereli]
MSQGDSNPAAIPHAAEDIQGDDRWMSQHNRFVLDCKDKEPDVLFVGDSMVQLMQQYEIWRELFSPLHALNFGIGGDTTRHVLWRLKNGELENIKPKVIVVWVGTNNHENTAEEVAGGIEAIVQLINTRQPQAKIIVLIIYWQDEQGHHERENKSPFGQLDCGNPILILQTGELTAWRIHYEDISCYHEGLLIICLERVLDQGVNLSLMSY